MKTTDIIEMSQEIMDRVIDWWGEERLKEKEQYENNKAENT